MRSASPAATARRVPLPLLALSMAAFGIGTSEFVIMGLLPGVARDLAVSIPRAGWLVTAYALGVTFGGPPVAMAVSKLPRKTALLLLMGVFMLGNLACALAPTYPLLMAARVLTALSHASFFGIATVVGAGLVPREQRARAIALIMTGLTLANIIGVPLGAYIGQIAGWRVSFAAIVGLGALAAVAVALVLPRQPADASGGRMRDELVVLTKPSALVAFGISVFLSASLFSVFTYIAPMLQSVTGLTPTGTAGALLLFGVGCTVGNVVGGRLADWKGMTAVIGLLLASATVMAALAFTVHSPALAVATVALWGAVGFAAGPGIQARVLDTAHEAPNLAATLNHSAFNLGNASGAWIGGAALTAGVGYASLPWLGATLGVIGLGVALTSVRLERSQSRSSTQPLEQGA